MLFLKSLPSQQSSIITQDEDVYERWQSDVEISALTQMHGIVQPQRKLRPPLCTSDKRSHPCLNVSDQSLLHEITLHCEDKIWWKTVLKMTNTHSLGKKIPPNCVNNVEPLITLARCKMGLVLMLGHTAWNIQIEVPYIRQRFLIYFIYFFWHTIGECLITQPFSDSHVEMLIWLSKHNYAAEGQPRHFLALFIKNMRIKVRLLTTKRQDTELRR